MATIVITCSNCKEQLKMSYEEFWASLPKVGDSKTFACPGNIQCVCGHVPQVEIIDGD